MLFGGKIKISWTFKILIMKISIDRVVAIISFMYGENAELVADISAAECYLYFSGIKQNLLIRPEEVNCLVLNNIIELDGGCDEEDHKTEVYVLTADAQQHMTEIIKNKKLLSLKEWKEVKH